MRLSEAMRLGGMTTKQAFGRAAGSDGSACAVMAACMAANLDYYAVNLPEVFGITFRECPACDYRSYRSGHAFDVLAHLNDDHRWSREQIADWVATIEAQQEQPASPVSVAGVRG